VDGTLFEAHQSVTTNDARRHAFSEALAEALVELLEIHYAFELRRGTCSPPP
jgi:hypothetical protein